MIPWSYTFLDNFANCPHKAYRRYIAKDLPKEPATDAMRAGIEAHKELELSINKRLPVRREWEPLIAPLRNIAKAEVKFGMTEDRQPIGFFDDPWGRGVCDVLIIKDNDALLVDWKTGKVREDPRELQVQAMLLKTNYPQVQHIKGCYVWLAEAKFGTMYDLEKGVDRCYHATKAAVEEAKEYEDDFEWPKKPNPLCGWCPVSDCEHNRRGK